MKGKVFALLLAASLVSASISPVAADDFTIEMQSQDIAFDEPEFSNEEDSAAGFEEEDNEEDKTPSDDIVVEDSYDEDFAGEDDRKRKDIMWRKSNLKILMLRRWRA